MHFLQAHNDLKLTVAEGFRPQTSLKELTALSRPWLDLKKKLQNGKKGKNKEPERWK